MATGIKVDGVDTDDLYEGWKVGDNKSSLTGYTDGGQDLSHRYCAVDKGVPVPGFAVYRDDGVDFNQLWARKGSVARYPTPLPWDRSLNRTVTIYRQPSRPTLQSSVYLTMSIHQSGAVAITQTNSPYNSSPNDPQTTHFYTGADTPLWAEAGLPADSPYEVRIDSISGQVPGFGQGGPIAQWLPLKNAPNVQTFGIALIYTHNESDGTKQMLSDYRVSVRHKDFPTTNQANAVMQQDLRLIVEPSAYRDDLVWDSSYTVSNGAATNYQSPGAAVHTYKSALRFTITTDRKWTVEAATWKNNETPIWSEIDWGPILRSPFPLADFNVMFTLVSGGWTADDTPITTGTYLELGAANQSFTIQRSIPDNSDPGVYNDDVTMLVKLRQISTANWVGLPDNTFESQIRLTPQVVIQAPNIVNWPSLAALDTDFIEFHDVVRSPGGQAVLASSLIRVVVRTTGVVQIMNSINFVLTTVNWKPDSLAMSQLEVRVVCPGAISNPLSDWTTIGYDTVTTLTAISRTNEDTVGTYEDVENFFFQVRSKLNVSDINSQESTAIARVQVLTPAPMDWPFLGDMATVFSQSQTLPYSASGPGSALESNIRLNVGRDGALSVLNSYNTTLKSTNWKPAFIDPSQFEVRVVCPNAVSNSLANWTSLTMLTQITLVVMSKFQNEAPGVYTSDEDFSFQARAKSNPLDMISVIGTAVAEIIISGQANVLVPATDYDNYAGSYTASTSGSI